MNEKYVCDMTKGNVVGLLLKFALPMLVGNIFQQLYNMVDSIIVGKFVGIHALGAVGVVGILNFLFFSLCLGLASGIGILISQYFGAGKDDYVKKIIANSVYIITVSGAAMSIISFVFARPILQLMKTPAANMEDAVIYMQIVCGGTIVVSIYNGISSILRALGDSKTPLIFLIISSFLNVGLDLLFILVFHWGVAGAAWATVIAQFISAAGSILFAIDKNPYLKLEKRQFALDREIIKKSCEIGLPLAGQNALIAFSGIALQIVVNNYGATVMAAYTATSRIEQLVQQPFGSLGTAISTFAGQNVGAGNYDRVGDSCKKGTLMVLVFSLMMIVVMLLFGNPIVSLFVDDPEVIKIGARGLRITSFMYFALGMIYVMRAMLNGVGDATYSMINGLTEVAGRIGFAYLLMMIPAVGIWGVWYTNGFTWVLAGTAGVIRFFQGKWKTKCVVTDTADDET